MAKYTIGIEISDKNIKIIYGRKKYKNFDIDICKSINLKHGIVGNGKILNEKVLLGVISDVLKDNNIKGKNVVVNIQSTSVIIRNIILPKVKKYELDKLIEFQKQEYFPIDISEYKLDYSITNIIKQEKEEKYNIMLVAIPNTIINSYVKLFNNLDIIGTNFDISENSIARAFKKYIIDNENLNNETIVVVDIEHCITNIIIISENQILFNRTIPYGVEEFNNIIEDDKDDITLEINKLLDFYNSRFRDIKLMKLYIIGEGTYIKNIDKYMISIFNIDVVSNKELNSIIQYKYKKLLNYDDILCFIGLIGLVNKNENEKFNLLPEWHLEKLNIKKFKLSILWKIITIVSILFIFIIIPHIMILQKKKLISEIDSKISDVRYNESSEINKKLNQTQKQLDKQIDILNNIENDSIVGSNIFEIIMNTVPNNIYIDTIDINNITKQIIINGKADNSESYGILEYVANLGALNNIRNINFNFPYKNNLNDETDKMISYTIEFELSTENKTEME